MYKKETSELLIPFYFELNDAPIQIRLFEENYFLKSIGEAESELPKCALFYRKKKAYVIKGSDKKLIKNEEQLTHKIEFILKEN